MFPDPPRILLAVAVGELVTLARERSQQPAIDVLDTLLLVFIVIELLFAVRTTITRRELVAEPFLLVGIIASIKEIVVLSVKAADDAGEGSAFTDQLLGRRARRPRSGARPHGLAAAPHGLAAAPQGLAAAPQGLAAAPQGLAAAPQGAGTGGGRSGG